MDKFRAQPREPQRVSRGLPLTSQTIGFAGLSHLGIVSSAAVASKGFEVTGYDSDAGLCASLTAGRSPVLETGLLELMESHKGSLRYTNDISDLKECGLVYFSADIVTDNDNQGDLQSLRNLISQVVDAVTPETILVVLSQVPPGFTRGLVGHIPALADGGKFQLFCQVETLVIGDAVQRAVDPERNIVGRLDGRTKLPDLYQNLLDAFDAPVFLMGYESAELTKASINMFLASTVSTCNTLAEVCEVIGADWSEIVPALKSDRRIGQYAYLQPGLGLSGGNIERDMAAIQGIASEFGTDACVVDAWFSNSRHRLDWVLNTLHSQVISKTNNPSIGVWGLAYKANTNSITNSPAISLLKALVPTEITVYDPQIPLDKGCFPNIRQASSAIDAAKDIDGLVVTTPWAEFSDIDLASVKEAMRGDVIIDPFGALDHNASNSLGFAHHRLGSRFNSRQAVV